MIPNVQQLIQAAMRNKRRLMVYYNGRKQSRVIEPHLLYRAEGKTLTLLAYQVRGYHSSRRQGSFWRPFQLGKFDRIRVLNEMFHPRVSEGFDSVCALIPALPLAKVANADGYDHFDPRVCGPPTPVYLAPSPTLKLRLAADNRKTATR